jgi:hypothetical protein
MSDPAAQVEPRDIVKIRKWGFWIFPLFMGSAYYGELHAGLPGYWAIAIFYLPFLLIFIKKRCPQCSSREYGIFKNLYKTAYQHETKDGKRDKRYKGNRLREYYKVSCFCNKCGFETENSITIE